MSYNESLRSNSNYPAMSQHEWDKAPWNQKDLPYKEFSIYCEQSLYKDCSVKTSDYSIEDGEYNTFDTDWYTEFSEQHYTPLELINILREKLEKELKLLEGVEKNALNPEVEKERKHLLYMIQECSDWNEAELSIGDQ